MNENMLVFNPGAVVRFGGNSFINVPILLQVDDTPIVETVQEQNLSRTTQFAIFNQDGVYLAKVVGTRIFPTADGEKAGISLRHPDKLTVCEMQGKTLFEVKRDSAAAVAVSAELYSPGGLFVKANTSVPFGTFAKNGTQIGGSTFIGNVFQGCRIGYWLRSDGRMAIGSS